MIKELERFQNNAHAMDPSGRILEKETARDQIAREVKARLELAGAKKKVVDKAAAKAEKAAAKAEKAKKIEPEKADAKAEPADAKAEPPAGEEAAAAVEATTDSSSGATEATT